MRDEGWEKGEDSSRRRASRGADPRVGGCSPREAAGPCARFWFERHATPRHATNPDPSGGSMRSTRLIGVLVIFFACTASRSPAQASECRTIIPDSSAPTPQLVFPRYLRGPIPQYPHELLRSGITGEAALQFVVTCKGSVDSSSILVLGASDSAFAAPAIKAIRDTRFLPALFEGKPVAMRIEQRLRFVVRNKPRLGTVAPWWVPQRGMPTRQPH